MYLFTYSGLGFRVVSKLFRQLSSWVSNTELLEALAELDLNETPDMGRIREVCLYAKI